MMNANSPMVHMDMAEIHPLRESPLATQYPMFTATNMHSANMP